LYRAFKDVFVKMTRDVPAESGYVERSVGKTLEAYFLPYPRASAQTDPVHQALSEVSCSGAGGGTGYHGRTSIRIAMYAWNGRRGIALAREIVDLRRRGCVIRVAYGPGIGRMVKRILGEGGVSLKGVTAATSHVHTKYMIVSGSWGGDTSSRIVWTGSQNWTARSLNRDEATIRVKGLKPFRGYQAHFGNLWNVA
jgi:phosphatidylserine/phosphatidylglycerophosphate/cardiolipin synthase-like enzyme